MADVTKVVNRKYNMPIIEEAPSAIILVELITKLYKTLSIISSYIFPKANRIVDIFRRLSQNLLRIKKELKTSLFAINLVKLYPDLSI